jgi:hypothetical protein
MCGLGASGHVWVRTPRHETFPAQKLRLADQKNRTRIGAHVGVTPRRGKPTNLSHGSPLCAHARSQSGHVWVRKPAPRSSTFKRISVLATEKTGQVLVRTAPHTGLRKAPVISGVDVGYVRSSETTPMAKRTVEIGQRYRDLQPGIYGRSAASDWIVEGVLTEALGNRHARLADAAAANSADEALPMAAIF